MESKKKDRKIASATNQESETNDIFSVEEQNESNVVLAAKNTGGPDSPSHAILPSCNLQYPSSVLQWPHSTQYAVPEQPPSSSRPRLPSPSPPNLAVSQWHQLPHLQRHGYHFPELLVSSMIHPFSPFGKMDVGCRVPAGIGFGATSKELHPQVPNFCYPFSDPYPGCPGSWDPSSWWGHFQQLRAPSAYNFSGAYGQFSSQLSTMTGCVTSLGQSFQKGLIRPPAKLSRKHQQLWEAQSAENAQLWTVIDQLKSDIADYRRQLMKLETEVSSLKRPAEEPIRINVVGTNASGQASKRGRLKRSAASVNALSSPNESPPCARGRKPAQRKVQTKPTSLNFERGTLNRSERKEKPCNPTVATILQEGAITSNTNEVGVNERNLMMVMPSFQNQNQHHMPELQSGGVGFSCSLETKSNDVTVDDPNNAFAVLYGEGNVINNQDALDSWSGPRNSGSLVWHPTVISEDGRINVSNTSSRCVYDQRRIKENGWSFGNEQDASEELEDADGNDETSGDEGNARKKCEGLPQLSN